MAEAKLGAVESRFADIIWRNEPLTSGELVKLCEKELGWKRSTTYTILKRTCNRGIFKNEGGIVSSILSREDFSNLKGETLIDDMFRGSLPAFLASFGKRQKLSQQELAEAERLIEEMRDDK